MLITCPSGLIVTARKPQGAELKTLALSAGTREGGTGVADVLRACWVSTETPGPYAFVGSAAFNWKRVVNEDVLVALIELRKSVRGSTFDFVVACEHCGEKNEIVARLDELEMRPLPAATEKAMCANEKLETKTLEGKTVRYALFTIEMEELILAQHKQMKKRPEWFDHKATFLDRLAGQISYVEGLDNGKGENVSNEFTKRLQWLMKLDADVIYDLQAKMEDASGGIDTGVEFSCTSCHWEQTRDIPLGQDFFNAPKKMQKKPAPSETPTETTTTEIESPAT